MPIWNRWIQEIGFGKEMVVEDTTGSGEIHQVNDSVAELAEAGE